MIGSETFIIVAFRCSEKSTPSAFALAICSPRKATSAVLAHEGGVEDFAGLERRAFLEHLRGAIGADEFDLHIRGGGDGDGFLIREEVTLPAHGADGGLRVGGPLAHRVRMLPRVVLHGLRRAAVGVAFAQDGIHRAAHDLVVAGLECPSPRRSAGFRDSREARSLWPAARRWPPSAAGTEAQMFGSLMMLASGSRQSCRARRGRRDCFCASVRSSGNCARMRPASEMSRVSTAMPACLVNACTMGSSE